jgi:phosphoglycerate dehydrogenase-like enzyme
VRARRSRVFSGDLFPNYSRQFFSAVRKAPNLKWLHAFNVGVDHPIYTEMLGRGVRVTTSAGSTADPIAQTAITGLLMLARPFQQWLTNQRERRWEPIRTELPGICADRPPSSSASATSGNEIARLARALGLIVIGIRRSPRKPDDPVDELYPPERCTTCCRARTG